MKKVLLLIVAMLSIMLFGCSPKTYDVNDSPIVQALSEYTEEGVAMLEKSFVNEENLGYALKFLGATPLPIELKTIDEKDFNIESIKGKNTIIEIKRISCPTCKENTPIVNEYVKNNTSDIEIIPIFYTDSKEAIELFYKAYGYEVNDTILSATYETSKTFLEDYYVTSVPTYLFIDSNYRISNIHIGALDETILSDKINEAFYSEKKLYDYKIEP